MPAVVHFLRSHRTCAFRMPRRFATDSTGWGPVRPDGVRLRQAGSDPDGRRPRWRRRGLTRCAGRASIAAMQRHADQRALVTGGTSGIGEAIVTRLAEDGARVVFTGRDEARGEAVARRTGARFVRADALDPAAVRASVEAAVRAARRPRHRRPERRRAVRGHALGDLGRAVGHRHRRRTSSRPFRYAREVLPALRDDARVDGARRLRRRRVGRDADRRLLRLEAHADHAHAHARGRGRARPACA